MDAPAAAAWEQLHRFDDYPKFVSGLRHTSTRGADVAHLDVKTSGGKRELEATITDGDAGRLMSWETADRPGMKGEFTLRTRTPTTPASRSGSTTTRTQSGRPSAARRASPVRRDRPDRPGRPCAIQGSGRKATPWPGRQTGPRQRREGSGSMSRAPPACGAVRRRSATDRPSALARPPRLPHPEPCHRCQEPMPRGHCMSCND
ncbi:SRPBCC family protein [Streptomyces xanthophaeus]|uniref:SRPBCC family protein n=1 Tax=Streptomyces xanthophaeus TaxID=67385 RepID=UPI0039901664